MTDSFCAGQTQVGVGGLEDACFCVFRGNPVLFYLLVIESLAAFVFCFFTFWKLFLYKLSYEFSLSF